MNDNDMKENTKRIDQDINFNLYGVSCNIRLDFSGCLGGGDCDIFIITNNNERKLPFDFLSKIKDKIRALEDVDRDYTYDANIEHIPQCDEAIIIKLYSDDLESLSISSGIMCSLPEWDGESLDFMCSNQFRRFFLDLKSVH